MESLNTYFLEKYKIVVSQDQELFTLSSGLRTDTYYDFRPLLLDDEDMEKLIEIYFESLWSGLDERDYDNRVYIIGLEFWGAVFTIKLPRWDVWGSFIPIILRKKKSHGIGQRLYINEKIDKRRPIVLIDDVLTSGKSVSEAIDFLKHKKIQVDKVLVLLNRGKLKTINGIPVESIFQLSIL
jgi:orotate phosphoribosyltransferase